MKKTKNTRATNLIGLENNFENDKMKVSGHAAVFDSPTTLYEIDGIEYKEVVARGAFDSCDFSQCCLKYNHSDHVPILARIRGGSLKLSVDDIGLFFEAELFDTTTSRDVYSLVKQGGLDKCSFAFTIDDEVYDSQTHTRTINKIGKLFDVSIVDIPAYDDTDVSARDYFKLENEKVRALEKVEGDKRKLLRLKIVL